MLRRAFRYLADTVRRPREELTRRQRQLRYSWDLLAHCWRVLYRHRAQGMAAELTYRTIFALIPLAVLGLVMFNVVGGVSEVRDRVESQLYSFFGVPDIAYEVATPETDQPAESPGAASESPADQSAGADQPPADTTPSDQTAGATASLTDTSPGDVTADTPTGEPSEEEDAEASIRRVLTDTVDKVASLDFASIGLIGLLLFIYAALSLTDSVEQIFNTIFEAPDGRPIHLRLAIHWSMITLGSGLLGISLYLSGQFVDYVSGTSLGAGSGVYLNHLAGIVASWVLLFLLYALMPNAKVSMRAAMVGALVAALLWEAAKFGFQAYVRIALPYSALYGSLGLIPLFLFWVYITWWIFLFGLVWTYTVQTVRGRVPTKEEDDAALTASGDPDWMLPVMVEVGCAFDRGEKLTRGKLVERLGLPGRSVHQLCEALVDGGLLRQIDNDSGSLLLPALPLEKMTVDDVLTLNPYGHQASKEGPAWSYLEQLDQHRRQLAKETSIAELIEGAGASHELP